MELAAYFCGLGEVSQHYPSRPFRGGYYRIPFIGSCNDFPDDSVVAWWRYVEFSGCRVKSYPSLPPFIDKINKQIQTAFDVSVDRRQEGPSSS